MATGQERQTKPRLSPEPAAVACCCSRHHTAALFTFLDHTAGSAHNDTTKGLTGKSAADARFPVTRAVWQPPRSRGESFLPSVNTKSRNTQQPQVCNEAESLWPTAWKGWDALRVYLTMKQSKQHPRLANSPCALKGKTSNQADARTKH